MELRQQIILRHTELLRDATRKLFIEGKIKDNSLIERVATTKKYNKLWKLYEIAFRIVNNIPSAKTQRRNNLKKALVGGMPIVSICHSSEDNTKTQDSVKPIYVPMGGKVK